MELKARATTLKKNMVGGKPLLRAVGRPLVLALALGRLPLYFASLSAIVARPAKRAVRRRTCSLAILLLVAAGLGRGLPPRDKGVDELMLQILYVHDLPVTMVETNHGPIWVVIDTGAEASILDDALWRSNQTLCLQVQKQSVCGTALRASQVPQFARLQTMSKPPQIKAVIGNDILRQFEKLLVDYRNGIIRLTR
jgi:hypothetical protein